MLLTDVSLAVVLARSLPQDVFAEGTVVCLVLIVAHNESSLVISIDRSLALQLPLNLSRQKQVQGSADRLALEHRPELS
jgi:hypothetical protein